MDTRQSPVIAQEVVVGDWTARLRTASVWQSTPKKIGLVVLALFISTGLVTGICQFSAQGDIAVLKQRLVGQVHLSTGSHSARTVSELNQLSWDNGLLVLEALDTVNKRVGEVEKLRLNPQASKSTLAHAMIGLKKSVDELDVLLQDRKTLLSTAQLLKTSQLYSPVFEEYMKDTMAKVQEVQKSLAAKESLAQQ